jgi:hypothetical protein
MTDISTSPLFVKISDSNLWIGTNEALLAEIYLCTQVAQMNLGHVDQLRYMYTTVNDTGQLWNCKVNLRISYVGCHVGKKYCVVLLSTQMT